MKSDNFELDNFLYGLLLLLLSFSIYFFNKWWIRKMKSKGEEIDSYDKSIVSKRILAIYVSTLLSIVFFLKAFKLWD
ncbi:hypothetical protein SAMN02927937_00864 [Paenimyroides aquimaris]|uniref:Uncharacterized protein n=1 Tax=Paenimyroides marinum TaxID=1159016 RepID=A0A1H6K629_9FLAO|nr:hypothetical protein [Paenimyroides aquimaris]SEH68464.1 hypothetical protein SAMN02927937_00864 [Paenimyroides aquimaris]